MLKDMPDDVNENIGSMDTNTRYKCDTTRLWIRENFEKYDTGVVDTTGMVS